MANCTQYVVYSLNNKTLKAIQNSFRVQFETANNLVCREQLSKMEYTARSNLCSPHEYTNNTRNYLILTCKLICKCSYFFDF